MKNHTGPPAVKVHAVEVHDEHGNHLGWRLGRVRSAATHARIPPAFTAPIAGRKDGPVKNDTCLPGSVPARGFVRLAVRRARRA